MLGFIYAYVYLYAHILFYMYVYAHILFYMYVYAHTSHVFIYNAPTL